MRRTNLEKVLELTGSVRDKCDASKWHTPRGPVSTTGAKFMNWKTGVGGGGAIDLAMHLNECDFKTAVTWLTKNFAHVCADPGFNEKCLYKKIFRPPRRCDEGLARIKEYLHGKRRIPLDTINTLIESGRLYADDRNNAVFPMLGKRAEIVGAELRGTGAVQWRGMALGSRKNLGAFIVNMRKSKKMVICESAIDAISVFLLRPWCIAVSTSGVAGDPAWLRNVLAGGYEVFCGFDSDEAGEHFARKMIRNHPSIKRMRPELKDWNDILKMK